MIKVFITIALIFSINPPSIAQENEKYIDNQIMSIEKLISKGTFEKGAIYLDNDTLKTELLIFKGKRKINHFLFCVAKIEQDSINVFKPYQIKGYSFSDGYYISHNSEKSGFFLKQNQTGKIDLYEKPSLPDDNRVLYYLKFPFSNNYFIINPVENNVIINEKPTNVKFQSTGADRQIITKGIHEKFKNFILTYLNDCDAVTNLVKSEFYTINDLPRIIESYNNCSK